MKKLGIYISSFADTAASSPYLTKGSFVYYELTGLSLRIWCPSKEALIHKKPEEIIFLRSQDDITRHVISIYDAWTDYYMLYNGTIYRMKSIQFNVDYMADCQVIDDLNFDSIDGHETCNFSGDDALRILYKSKAVKFDIKTSYFPRSKETVVSCPIYKRQKLTAADIRDFSSLTIPETVDDMIKKHLKESLEKLDRNALYGRAMLETSRSKPVLTISPEEVSKLFNNKNKETKTMEKKKMTETDSFLKNLNGITITSTYSKLDHGCGKPYYIYYPEMDITEDMADTLLTVLLMAKREYIHKVVFNPEKGTTTIYSNYHEPVTVRCKDAKFDYILGYNMARSKGYLGSDDYNWFNKIKNHRKTHIEYTEKPTEPKAKRTSKKGGKK